MKITEFKSNCSKYSFPSSFRCTRPRVGTLEGRRHSQQESREKAGVTEIMFQQRIERRDI